MRKLWSIAVVLCLAGTAITAGPSEAPYYLALAKVQADEGRYSKALESFAKAVALAPEDVYIRLELAELLLRLGRVEEAADEANTARRLAPEDLDVLKVSSRTHLRLAESSVESLSLAKESLQELQRRAPGEIDSLVSLGQIYLGESDFAGAAEVFRQALEQRPSHRGIHSLLVEALLRSGQTTEAEVVLQEALAIDPEFTRARLKLADLQSERGDHLAAARSLERAAISDPSDTEIRRRFGLELYRAGDVQGALEAVEKALEDDPADFAALYLKGLTLTALGRHEEAADLLRGLRERRPESLDLALLQARVLERQELNSEAAEVLLSVEELLRANGDDAGANRARLESAALFSRNHRWDAVVEMVEPLVQQASGEEEEIDLLLLYAEALVGLDRVDEALALLRENSVAGPRGIRVTAKLAEILFEVGRGAEAEEVVQALAADGDLDSLSLAAEVYQRAARYSQAIPVLQQALERRPKSIQLLFWLGASFERSGQQTSAAQVFEELLSIEPEFAPALNYLGYMWAEGGQNLERALDLVRQAVALDPDNGAYADSLGWAHFQLGNYEEARDHLERAAQLIGEDAVVFEHLGDLYMVLKQLDEAGGYYQRALALEAENAEQVQQKLERLRQQLPSQ